MNNFCVLNSGDFVPALWPPFWTPYAQAIAKSYGVQVPLFMTIPTTLTGVTLQRRTVVTNPLQYDALILGATLQPDAAITADFGQDIFLDLFDNRSGINWVTPNIVGGAPLTAFGGRGDQATSVMRLPEAFFLPANTRLQHEFTQPTGGAATGGSITWVGVQLINPIGGKAPDAVKMPNGDVIRVGGRMPWLSTWGIGLRSFSAGALTFGWPVAADALYYTPPVDCPLEIHDLHTTSFSTAAGNANPDQQLAKLAVSRRRDMWTADLTPFTGMFGDRSQVYQALPLAKPLKLAPFERLIFRFFNLGDATGNTANRMIVVRGVRLCEF